MHRFCLFAIALVLFSLCADGQVCSSESSWPGYQKTCEKCFALVQTGQSTCRAYCASLSGHFCADAAEDPEGNLCSPRITTLPGTNTRITCDTNLKTHFAGTSDFLCKCVTSNGPAPTPRPSVPPTPRPPTPRPPTNSGGTGRAQFSKPSGTKFRIASYNVQRSSIIPGVQSSSARVDSFKRIANQVNADVWVLQEMMYDGTGSQASANKVKAHFESITGKTWYMAGDYLDGSNTGEVIMSRYPMDNQRVFGSRIYGARVRLPGYDVFVFSVHLTKTEHGAELRDRVADLRSGKYGGTVQNLPVLVCGDFNALRGSSRVNYIAKYAGFKDLNPYQLDTTDPRTIGDIIKVGSGWEMSSTSNTYDFHIYEQKAGPAVSNAFILNTFKMINLNGLERWDSASDPASCRSGNSDCRLDHMPIVSDYGGTGPYKASFFAEDSKEGDPNDPFDQVNGSRSWRDGSILSLLLSMLTGFFIIMLRV